jgi:glutamine amidotransferase
MIGIVDYHMGNLASVINAFAITGAEARVESDPEALRHYDRLILPGVGAFGDAMAHLQENGMDAAIRDFVTTGRPMLGICLGMQLLFESSEEFGSHSGLGLIPGRVAAFDKAAFDHPNKVPHMGWNELFTAHSSPLFAGLPEAFYLYFVHSFHAKCPDAYVIGETHYGYRFASAVQQDNVYGIQPHPEKSHQNGLRIIQNFSQL